MIFIPANSQRSIARMAIQFRVDRVDLQQIPLHL